MKILTTVGGECFEATYIDVGNPDGRDGVLYYFKLKDLVKDRGLRNVSLFRSGTDKIFIEDYDARVEGVRLNVLRRAFDSGAFSFETPTTPDRFHELQLKAADFQPQKKANDETIRDFIKFGAYYLGFKYSPTGPNPFVDFDCLEDLEYLGANSQDIGRNVRLLTEEGYLRSSSAATLASPLRVSPTSKLIREVESGEAGSSSLLVASVSLGEVEREICNFVVHRLLDQNEVTSERALLREFKGRLADPLRKLLDRYVLKFADHTNETYLPKAITFHYCGDGAALAFARKSTETVLRVVLSLFEQTLEDENKDQKQFTPADVETEACKLESDADAKMVRVGLYLSDEFGVFYTQQRDARQLWVSSFRPGKRIYEVMKSDNVWDDHIRQSNVSVERAWEKRQSESTVTATPSDNDIFDVSHNDLGLQVLAGSKLNFDVDLSPHARIPTMPAIVPTIIKGMDELRTELSEIRQSNRSDEGLQDAKLKAWTKRAYERLKEWGFTSEAEEGFGRNSHIIMYQGVDTRAKMRDDRLKALRDELSSHPEHYEAKLSAPRQSEDTPVVPRPHKIFLGHGHDKLWARVQIYLKDELHLDVEAWESNPRTGMHSVDVLKSLLNSCTFAVIIATGEDTTATGGVRARQNVVHEIGLFQGSLGFEKVALLQQESIEEFSNLAGLQVIPFQVGRIESAFYELQRMLKREKIIK